MGLLDRDYMREPPRPREMINWTSAPPPRRRTFWGTVGWWLLGIFLAALISAAVGLMTHTLVITPPTNLATNPFAQPVAPAAAPVTTDEVGVHVCAWGHYDRPHLACLHDVQAVKVHTMSRIQVSSTGLNGGAFTTTSLTVIVARQRTDSGYDRVGSFQVPAGLSYGSWSLSLQSVLANVGQTMVVAPSSYKIEVDDGSTLLGDQVVNLIN